MDQIRSATQSRRSSVTPSNVPIMMDTQEEGPKRRSSRSHQLGKLEQSRGYNIQDIHEHDNEEDEDACTGICSTFLMVISIFLVAMTFPLSLFVVIKQIQEYQRAVIFRLGRVKTKGAMGPGLFFVLPCIDKIRVVDIRTVSFNVPPQEILSKDSVTVTVDAVVYYRIQNPMAAVCNVADFNQSTRLLAATSLRTTLGMRNLTEILSEREQMSIGILETLEVATEPWGIKVERVEVKDVKLPQQLQRAMAAEAEATREARAKVIAAEGEQKASRALQEAANVISQSPAALQLRYLQTLSHISAEKNSTVIFPLPIDLLQSFMNKR
ncbi:hypothetical protein TCAL_04634 [Tigriopus californicus]|uniref:Band 7 domain-containing protein n=1 Tax=Tigriopus californicus TaxID=6832 RepID=A0A553NBB5_TIGCA|nr:band 7 protein AGAP004871-like [Tigriopus californicus]TRY62669.1 hypothetical protein TCAL_04634 [Tigriopus californicus]|eukprot:TCALIF_04634-PA protein Name:"Similar to sto-2 Stomatin-2 (Caenorhabditis elegans)" AED:0.05 eAED:0.05 QI:154/1/1/1/1/1/3/314/324